MVGASPALAVTTGSADPELAVLDEPALDEPEFELSDIEVTPKRIAPSITKTRTAARTERDTFFIERAYLSPFRSAVLDSQS
jgi:hypothetical protein